MKRIILVLLSTIIMPLCTFAVDANDKAAFYTAKAKIEKMLTGEQPISYEEAIYQLENAWWAGGISREDYRQALDYHTANIIALANAYYDSAYTGKNWLTSTAKQQQMYRNAINNYAIYQYMTNGTITLRDDKAVYNPPYTYSNNDPKGTTDWSNTHVSHLINTGEGNCFALASLYKIFADRLQTGAKLATAPGHIYVRHADDKGVWYNIELTTRSFPGTGTIETITHTTRAATKSGIALRDMDTHQAVATCLVYLAKGCDYKFGEQDTKLGMACAEAALQYDGLNLNAMLLKAELMETRLMQQAKELKQLRRQDDFIAYELWLQYICRLGYREIPAEMKNILVQAAQKDTVTQPELNGNAPDRLNHKRLKDIRYAGLSWGMFDEEIKDLPIEQYGNTLFDSQTGKITGFSYATQLYNQYNFDPVVFAMSIDPLVEKYPYVSPYNFSMNTPIQAKDPDGRAVLFINGIHTGSGGSAAYWGGYDKKVMDIMKDHSARYIDGALGGWKNTGLNAGKGGFMGSYFGWVGSLVGAGITVMNNSNVNMQIRINAGLEEGYNNAQDIISNLKDGETIKIISHSMGTAFARGYTEGVMKYANEHNVADKIIFEYELDINSFQGADLPADVNVRTTHNKTGGLDGGNSLRQALQGNSVPTVSDVPLAENTTDETDEDNGHAIEEMSTSQIPGLGNGGKQQSVEQGNNNKDR